MKIKELIKLIDKKGYIFWVCPNGCRAQVEWSDDKTSVQCLLCGTIFRINRKSKEGEK